MDEVTAAAARGEAAAEAQRSIRSPGEQRPSLGPEAARAFQEYRAPRFPDFKAFFYSPGTDRWGSAWGYRRPEQAIGRAAGGCEGRAGATCRIYAIGDRIVAGLGPAELRAAIEDYYRAGVSLRERLSPAMHRLTGDEIRTALSGAVAEISLARGGRATARFFADGRLSAELLPPGMPGRNDDTGRWWIKDDMLCRQYSYWFEGMAECQWLVKDGETFKVFDQSLVLVSRITVASR